ncbi:MAG TPA: sugar-binding protein [Fimbriimonas sp.]|nr:sugar-binding protein [Fimbriimonas sp.]
MPVAAFAAPQVLPGYKIDHPPKVDGVIDESGEWKGVPSISGLLDENTNEKAADNGTFWIAYDADFIYIAARLDDSKSGQIRAQQYQTNVSLQGDDSLSFDLDVSGTATDFSTFQVNPKGATNIQLAGGRAAKREWAGEFQAASRITATGWETEMRIPWQVMKLPPAGPKDLRFLFERFLARTNRSYSNVYLGSGTSNTPIWKGVAVPKEIIDRSIKLLPYAYAGYDSHEGVIGNMGLDLKTALSDQTQLVASINPDFRNIENQILSLDFSRFQRLANESRPFFLEGSQYVGSALFASQLVPRFDVGVNTYGKLNDKTSFGALATTQYGAQTDIVANGTYAPDADSSYRFGVTSLQGEGIHNEAFLARYQKTFGPWTIFLRDMASQDDKLGYGDNDNAEIFYVGSGIFALAEYSRVDPNFNPRLGFFPEVDYRGFDGLFNYTKPWNHGPLSEAGGGLTYVTYDHVNGDDYRRDVDYNIFGTLRNGFRLTLDQDFAQFEGSNDHLTTLSALYPRGDPYNSAGATLASGVEAGIPYTSVALTANKRFFNRLQFIGRYQVVNYDGVTDQAIFDVSCDIGHEQAVYGRLAAQDGEIGGYLAYRRSGNLGAEYYLIVGDPNATTFRPSVILKVAIPLQIGSSHPRKAKNG